MAPRVDSAILKALGLDAASTRMSTHGGSGFSSTFKVTSTVDGKEVNYFVKTGTGKKADIMFAGEHSLLSKYRRLAKLITIIGEHASLNAIADVVPSFCPRSHAHGALADTGNGNTYFLATDFLDLGASSSGGARGSGLSFAAKLAKLHTTPAPTPPGYDKPQFGFPVPTCCGSTQQDNTWESDWARFYAERRLRAILRACNESQGGGDRELDAAVSAVADRVVPRLIGALKEPIVPVVVHGDLWSGNHGRGRIAGREGVEEVVYDASAVYGHSEYELGIMRMFGGFGSSFWREYERLVPKAEPKEEWDDRVTMYELYVSPSPRHLAQTSDCVANHDRAWPATIT